MLVAACGSRESILGAGEVAPLAPIVIAVTPADNATAVATNLTAVTASFIMALEPPSGATFALTCAAPCIALAGTLSLDGTATLATLSFAPGASLYPETRYTVTISGFRGLSTGAEMASPFVSLFTTGVSPDTTPPTLSSTTPHAGDVGVAINALIAASFSEMMRPLSVTGGATFTLACPVGAPVTGTVAFAANGDVATFTPAMSLPIGTICTATMGTGAEDIAGNNLLSAESWSFTTGIAPDLTPPTVSSTSPRNNDSGVATNALITATFSEPMDPQTLSNSTFTLTCPGGTPIVGAVGYAVSGHLATFTPATVLPANTICTANVSAGAEDVAGNAMLSARTWNFTTGAAPDVTPPTVNSTTPSANDSGVAINASIGASFSEAMNPLSVTTASFTLACPGGSPVVGAVGYGVNGNVATFTPAGVLPGNTTCTATVTDAVEDVAGNALPDAYTWSFTTGAAPDITAPTVNSTNPANNDTAIPRNALVSATFSEAMDPLTFTNTSFTVACPGGAPVIGTVGYSVSGNLATFTPTGLMPAVTLCTASLTTAVEDVAGNALASIHSWTFTTSLFPDDTPPSVSSTNPVRGETGVALNNLISASFSEAMDPLTVTNATFTLVCPGGTPVSGTIGYLVNGNVATFMPASALPASTTCSASITPGAEDVAGNAFPNAYSWSFTTGVAPDITAPTVSATSPIPNATAVASNSLVTASFSEAMAPLSITNATFTLACPGGAPISGSVAYAVSGDIATFTPAVALPASTPCTASISTGVRDVAGNAMAVARTWTFTTGVAPDLTAPTVSSTSPAPNATSVAINSLISASFSEAMNPLSITTATFTLACPGGTPITGTVGYAVIGNVATFTPTGSLPPSTLCTARITTGARDTAGNALSSIATWGFTTGPVPDTTAPTVSSTSPAAGASGVAINSLITATFSEAMAPLTVTNTSFTLACPGGTPIAGTVGYAVSGHIATFTPTPVLPATTSCTASIATAVEDVAGNSLGSIKTWTFTTGAAPDVTAPTVSSTVPAANETGVALNTLVSASFSEGMDPLSITTASFALACPGGTPVAGTVGYSVSGNVATFTPSAALPPSTICGASITTGVEDVAGNNLGSAKTWSFTTGVAPDLTAPTVSSTTPASGATAVAINSLITATFSEPMDALTITAASFTLACPGGTPITGTVGYSVSGNVATLTPLSPLPASSICAATVSTAVEDDAGNALQSANTWSFTTGIAPDITPPTVSSTSPAANDSGVALNASVAASFSEAMNPLTISTATFTLACPGGAPIAGAVGYASTGNVATFTPTSVLPPTTVCSATLATGVQDVAGNALASAQTWSFTTGATPDITAPTVTATTPAANDTAVSINSLITATFSEPMDALTVTATSFLLACPSNTPIAGTVAYSVSGDVATFTPTSALPATTVCAASVTTAVKDVAGNAMLAARNWSFTTGLVPDTTAPTATATNPVNGAVGVCINKTINATFSEPMDPNTITTANFTLAVTAGASVAGVVAYDTSTNIATFNPTANLIGVPATNYTATIKGSPTGVRDLAGNLLAVDVVTTFTTNAGTCATAPPLGAAAPFGGIGGVATLTNDGVNSVINGDIGVSGASTTVTGLHDSSGRAFTTTLLNNGVVNGLVYTTDSPTRSTGGEVSQALLDAQAAFTSISPGVLLGGINMADTNQCPSCGGVLGGADELAGRTLPPGIYLSSVGTFDLSGAGELVGNLTLDAGGDVNAVWIFQTTAGTLNVGLTGPAVPAPPIQMLLINGANSKNVFWHVPAGATIGTGSTVVGTIMSTASITFSTTGTPPLPPVTTLHGRALALTAAVTMANTVINRPAP